MTNKTSGQIQELSGHVKEIAGAAAAKKVMEGSEKATKSTDKTKIALWVKEAIDRLDATVEPVKRHRIMVACGHNCIAHNSRLAQAIKNRRWKHNTEEEFLKAEIKKPVKGIRLERQGNILTQYYTPRTYSTPRRCFCSLMSSLPEGTNASLTYCQCARGFIEKYWEGALGRPVHVEVIETTLTGAQECKFFIYL